MRTDAQIVADGLDSFVQGRIEEAGRLWSAIADPGENSRYQSFAKAYSAFDAAASAAEAALASLGPEAGLAAVAASGSPPEPPAPLAAGAADPLGGARRLESVGSQAAELLAARASEIERSADAELEYARSEKGGDPPASALRAQEGFAEAGRLYLGADPWLPEARAASQRLQARASIAAELRMRLLRNSLLSFPERMGEIFARVPSASERLGDKELLAFNAQTASIIDLGLRDFDRAVAEYPDILDGATIDRLRGSAQDLAVRFSRIESTIKAVRDRGRPLMPAIIGIFNPQPGDPQRSRPAAFSGRIKSGSDWWWGIADIPKGAAQDLVITMSDARPVRVYAAGAGPDSRPPASDLVNPLFRIGNSWPVLNAGERLENGVFHIEVGPSRSEPYSGEAVVYKSFMTRTR
jgi:hypothetical protein